MILNSIEKYDVKLHWKTLFWIQLKDMILNFIEWYKYEFYKNNIYKTYPRLISSLSFVNKSFMISIYSPATASNIAVL